MRKRLYSVSMLLAVVLVMGILAVQPVLGQKTTLTFWASASPTMDHGRGILFRDFERDNPEIKVEWQGVPYMGFTEKILTGVVAGTLPDVARYGYATRFAARDLLLPMDDFVKGPDGIDLNGYLDGILEGNASYYYQGKLYGLPFALDPFMLIYNTDIFKEQGLEPPTTWKELEATAEKLTKKGTGGEVERYGLQLQIWCTCIDGFVRTNGGLLTNVENQDATKATYSAPENVAGFEFLANMAKRKICLPVTGGSRMEASFFLDGKTAMWYVGSHDGYQIRPDIYPDFNWWVVNTPVPEGKPLIQPSQISNAVFIFKTTKQPELAWKLAKHYAWKQGAPLIWIHKFGAILPFKDVLDETTLNGYYYPFQFERHLKRFHELALERPWTTAGTPNEWHIKGQEIHDWEQGQYELMLKGEKSVKEVLSYLNSKVQALLPMEVE